MKFENSKITEALKNFSALGELEFEVQEVIKGYAFKNEDSTKAYLYLSVSSTAELEDRDYEEAWFASIEVDEEENYTVMDLITEESFDDSNIEEPEEFYENAWNEFLQEMGIFFINL